MLDNNCQIQTEVLNSSSSKILVAYGLEPKISGRCLVAELEQIWGGIRLPREYVEFYHVGVNMIKFWS